MLQAALANGTAHRRSVFELFPRRLPEGRRYGVVAGVGRALDAIEAFRFDDEALAALEDVVDEPTLDWLAGYRFTGTVWGYAEGEVYFPYSPLLIVESTFAEAVVLETLLLSIYNHDSAIASAASRMTLAAGDRPCIEMGSRRTHEEAAVAAARAAYVAGFASSSNLAARHRYGVPTAGTSAHSFTLLHDTEADAFRAPGRVARPRHHAAGRHLRHRRGGPARRSRSPGPELGAVRLDSGDLGETAQQVREPARRARRDRDPDRRHQRPRRVRHRGAGRGAGRRVRRRHRAGHRQRPPDVRLRLQAGRARGRRRRAGVGGEEEPRQDLGRRPQVRPAPARPARCRRGRGGRHRQRRPSTTATTARCWSPLVRDGEVVGRETLDAARGPARRARAELPLEAQQMSRGEPVIETLHVGG